MAPWRFAFATDIHVGSPRSFRFQPAWNAQWQTARRQIVDLAPDLLLVGGDLTRDGALPAHGYELEQIKADLDTLPFPYCVTPGNMDTGNKHTDVPGPFPDRRDDLALNLDAAALRRFEAVFGPSHWTMVHKDVRFTSCCDMVLGSGLPEEAALWAWIEARRGAPRAAHHVWMMHSPPFVDAVDEPTYDIRDPAQYHRWYFSMDAAPRQRLLDLLEACGVDLVLCGHVHCRKSHRARGIEFQIGPSTAFAQWGDHWPDGDDTLGFMIYEVSDGELTGRFVPLEARSDAVGYGPGGHPLPHERDYTMAWEKDAE